MNIQSTHINRARGASKPPAQQQEQLQQRIKSEAQDAFVNSNSGFSRVGYGMLSGATGSVAGAVAGTAVVAGIAQIADAVIPGNAFPVGALAGPVLGVTAAAFATASAIGGGVAGYKGEAGAHTNALTTRSAFRESASFHAGAAGAFMGAAATTGLAQAFFPQHTLVGAAAGLALGALAGHKVGKTVAAFGGNLATIPMKKAAGLEGSQYSGKLRAEAPEQQAHTTSKLTPIFDDKPMTADVMKTLSEAKESIRFETPSGHEMELVHEVEKLGTKAGKLNPTFDPSLGTGPLGSTTIAPPRIDHLLINAEEVGEASKFYMDVLGFRLTEQLVGGDGHPIGMWMERSHSPHDLAVVSGTNGALHHFAFWLDDWDHVRSAADILAHNAIQIDVGPTRHGVTRGNTIYFFDPMGTRNEVFTGGYRPDPDFPTITWTEDNIGKAVFYYEGEVNDRFVSVHT